MTNVGFDPVSLGVIITIPIEVGMFTLTVGMNLYAPSVTTGNRVILLQSADTSRPF